MYIRVLGIRIRVPVWLINLCGSSGEFRSMMSLSGEDDYMGIELLEAATLGGSLSPDVLGAILSLGAIIISAIPAWLLPAIAIAGVVAVVGTVLDMGRNLRDLLDIELRFQRGFRATGAQATADALPGTGTGLRGGDGPGLSGLKEQLGNIARGFGFGACFAAAQAMAQELRRRGIEYDIITLKWEPSFVHHNVYSNVLEANRMILPPHPGISERPPEAGVVSTNGTHRGVTAFPNSIFARTFCNAHRLGLLERIWINDFDARGHRRIISQMGRNL